MFNLEVLEDGRQDPEIQGVNGNLSIVSITRHTRHSKDRIGRYYAFSRLRRKGRKEVSHEIHRSAESRDQTPKGKTHGLPDIISNGTIHFMLALNNLQST